MNVETTPLDGVFKALSDPTRRAVVSRLCRGPSAVKELAKPFGMALPSFMQHLKVLEECGLVHSEKSGRVRTYWVVPARLNVVTNWLDEQRALWEQRLNQLDDYLLSIEEQK
ncbi:MAG: helix-turn-helix transcriptional regulator [Myxococcales bacterium]|nr:helix-turn-helix transcriptional regulator [Myxococcales bacterium]